MADAPIPAAPKKGMNPILKFLLIGCGVVVLLMIVVLAGCVYLGYKAKQKFDTKVAEAKVEMAKQGISVDTSNGLVSGIQSVTNQTIVSSMVKEGQAVIISLPESEQPDAKAVYKELDEKKSQLTAQDLADLIQAHKAYQESMMNNMPAATTGQMRTPLSPEASRALVSAIKVVLARH